MSAIAPAPGLPTAPVERRLPVWWALAGLVIVAAALRLSTIELQGFWYDEAFTPVHVLHRSLWATLRAVSHTENTPPLWYVIAWADSRVLGTGELALRLPSALAGIATVPVAWAIGRELGGRRAALLTAALVAVNPLFVWYSEEARAYALFALTSALALLCFLRARREPTRARMFCFALSGSLALLTQYFAVFLLAPMVLLLLYRRPPRTPAARRAAAGALAAPVIVGLALLPLISAQGGHGTQWIGRWALSSRLQAIPQYYLTGASGAPLGHGVELLVALPILAGLALGLWRAPAPPVAPGTPARPGALGTAVDPARPGEDSTGPPQDPTRSREDPTRPPQDSTPPRGAVLDVLLIAAGGILTPLLLAAFGADYLAPRNLIAAMIPITALIAVVVVSRRAGRAGILMGALLAAAFLAISIDVNLSPRLQRGDWRAVARALRAGARDRVITTVELGAAPLEYYLPALRNLPRGGSVTVSEIDESGYAPLRPSAGRPPADGFRLSERLDLNGLIVYRFVSAVPRTVSEATLRRHVITRAHPEVLVPAQAATASRRALARGRPLQTSSPSK